MLVARKDYRHATLFRLAFSAKAASGHRQIRGIADFRQENFIASLKRAKSRGDVTVAFNQDGTIYDGKIDNTHVVLEITAIQEHKDDKGNLEGYTFLFSYGNPYSADPGKKNTTNNQIERLVIGDKEHLLTCAHLYIGEVSTSGKHSGTAKCALESTPGLSRGKIIHALEVIAEKSLSNSERPSYRYEEKTPKKREISGVAELKLRPYAEKSESLKDDLESKELISLEFLGEPTKTDTLGLDGISALQEQIVLKVAPTHRTGSLSERLIRKAMGVAKSRKSTLKADFLYEEEQTAKRRTREIELDKTQFEDQLFTRSVRLDKLSKFESIYEKIDKDIVNALIEKVNDKGLWDG